MAQIKGLGAIGLLYAPRVQVAYDMEGSMYVSIFPSTNFRCLD